MGRINLDYLEGNQVFACGTCQLHLTTYNELISKAFKGKHGKAYLFNSVLNIKFGPQEQRILLSGLHIVSDILCKKCHTILGWKYDFAREESQKYKEGKYILEKAQLQKQHWTY
ncbi:hypothetical protein IMG5_195100 [Ichthyophthirius multifiliis]|uniref:Protein yippee-like n=1 Tax=Ichthyophthirius multifiliis TaxID=5932 RepID=G0R4W3_ICHMU|nr:hypothetical protein IMG5_195100 [Ichthyophthirius multifiliis]EGR27506.1 hypothetical protein IMG5_195100 [Ichthyophthirius multifiliis]|eukprot:XP_004024416.1 hypothetical protein IMG5_195100 [Ichthyophthirius multifiliis]